MLERFSIKADGGAAHSALLATQSADDAANRAARAFWAWSNTSAKDRADLLAAMAESLAKGRLDLIEIAAQEVGAAPAWIDFNIKIAQDTLHQARELIPLMEDKSVKHADGRNSILRRQAVGVVLGFAPWNAPVILATRALAAPIACGNTVVLKASEHCPNTHKMVVDLFSGCGLPENVVSVVTNEATDSLDVARTLIQHPTIRR